MLLRQVAEALLDAGWAMKRATQGDYTPDPKAKRFPPIEVRGSPSITFLELFESRRIEARPSPSTIATWKPVLVSLRNHVQHESAARLTKPEVISWKNALVKSELLPRTIDNTYLACLRALLSHGVKNHLLTGNVATSVSVKEKRVAGEGRLVYEDSEVANLLRFAAQEKHAARRWIPLLAACSGARAGELAQLWGRRVREINGVQAMELRPAEDGGTFKNAGSERVVPLHPVLIDAGFLEFVRQRGDGPLFYGRAMGRGERHASKGTVNHLAAWIRKQPGFSDPRKAPTQALRHWWKSAASSVGIQDSRADAIQGHKTQGEAARYRHFSLKDLARDVAQIQIPHR